MMPTTYSEKSRRTGSPRRSIPIPVGLPRAEMAQLLYVSQDQYQVLTVYSPLRPSHRIAKGATQSLAELGSFVIVPPRIPKGDNPRMKPLKNIALAAAVAVSVGLVGACASAVPPTTTTTESSTTAPPVTTRLTTNNVTCPVGLQPQSDGMCR